MTAILVPRDELLAQLKAAFSTIDSDTVAVHTDLMKIGIIDGVKPRAQLLEDYWQLIREVADNLCLLIPTFNYQYCRDGMYDVSASPAEVGVLNEYIRGMNPGRRTRTPVFNYCILNNRGFSLAAVDNPFSGGSTFGEMVSKQTQVVFFGAQFDANTFIHHVEEMMEIGYRYLKPFPGEIIAPDGSLERITLQYRVRPLDGSLEYDWHRLEAELVDEGLLQKFPLGHGHIMHYRADQLLARWSEKIRADELYLLTPDSRERIRRLYDRAGKPLTYAKMEGHE